MGRGCYIGRGPARSFERERVREVGLEYVAKK